SDGPFFFGRTTTKISGGVWTEDHDEDHPRPIENGLLEGTRLRFEVPQKAAAVVIFELAVNASTLDGAIGFKDRMGARKSRFRSSVRRRGEPPPDRVSYNIPTPQQLPTGFEWIVDNPDTIQDACILSGWRSIRPYSPSGS